MLYLFFLGLICGSFANVVIDRLAKGKGGILFGHSECPHCHHRLSAKDLIPLLSFIFLKGKCSYCQKKISLQYPLVEIVMGFVFGAMTLIQFESGVALGLSLFYLFILITISIYDLRYFEIPDEVILIGIAVAFLATLLKSSIAPDLFNALIGAIIPLTFFGLQYLISHYWITSHGDWIGLGDLRIAVFMGLILGWEKILLALFLAYLIGSIISLAFITAGKLTRQSCVPFGPFLALGTIVAFFWGQGVLDWYLGRFIL